MTLEITIILGTTRSVNRPLVWLVLLPFRLAGIAVDGVLGLLRAVVTFPARLVGGSGAR